MKTSVPSNRQGAFTLVELILIIVIAGLIMPPLVDLLVQINLSSPQVVPFLKPNMLAVEILEEIKGKRWDENWVGGPIEDSEKTPPGSLGPDSGESSRQDFDDVDDYIGIPSEPQDALGNPLPEYADYTVAVQVYYVYGTGPSEPLHPANFDFITPLMSVSNFKRVDVIVTGSAGEQYRVSTIVCNY